jgi:2-oxoisovalerate dehydrogenase E1 component
MVRRSLFAAQQAEGDGISAAVTDLCTIAPNDWATIATQGRQTNRVVIANEDQLTYGFGAEIAARIASDLFADRDAPLTPVGALDVPVPYQPALEYAVLQVDDVLNAIRCITRY